MEKVRKLSIILTTYNSIKNIQNTLDSIEMQDYLEIEVNIKDGGSTDGTLNVIKKYANTSKYTVNWITSPDQGIYDAMNQGYGLATGEIVLFFNEVFMTANAVSRMMKLIEDSPECIGAHADLVYVDDTKVIRTWKMGKQKSLYCGWMPGHPTLFLKRQIYEKYGLYKTNYQISADYEFMIRFLKDNENRLAYLPVTIIRMYYGGTSTSSTISYINSLREGHRALKENGIRFAWIADGMRTIRVLLQFIKR